MIFEILTDIKKFGGLSGLFNKSDIDIEWVNKYNSAIEVATDKQAILAQFTNGTNKATAELIKSANGMVISEKAKASAIKSTTLATKSATIATKALNAALNTGIMIAASLAISAIAKGLDALIVTTEEQQQKVNELKSSYETLSSEFKELSSKQELTDYEKERLEYLKRRLELDKQILDAETKILYQKEMGNGSWWDKIKDHYTGDSVSAQIEKEFASGDIITGNSINWKQVQAYINGYEATINEGKKLIKDLQMHENLRDSFSEFGYESEAKAESKQVEKAEKELESYYNTLLSKKKEYLSQLEDAQARIDSGVLTGEDLELAIQQRNQWQAGYEGIVETVYEVEKALGKFDDIRALEHEEFFNKEAIVELVNSGKDVDEITRTLSEDFPWLTQYMEENGITVQRLINEYVKLATAGTEVSTSIASITSIISTLYDLNGELDNLDNVLDNIKGEEIIELGNLDSIADYFLGLEDVSYNIETVNDALQLLGEDNHTLEEQREAINQLATEYLSTCGVLENLTEENAELMKIQLKRMGIINAEEIVTKLLARDLKTEVELESILATKKKAVTNETVTLTNVTANEIQELINEGSITAEDAEAMTIFALRKQFANGVVLNTSSDIANLKALLISLGATTNALDAYNKVKDGANGMPSYVVEQMKKDAEEEIEAAMQIAEDSLDAEYAKFDTTVDFDGSGLDDANSSAKDTAETFDWIETLISRIQRNITNLGKVVSGTYRKWSTRNNALAQEMAEVNKEISVQMNAYNAYMAKANSIPLAEGYKELVRNGAYRIEDIADETLREQISAYKEWYEKALSCSDAIEDLRANLAELAMTKFNNVSEQYDAQISLITHNVSMLEGFVSQSEAAGYMASEVYYKAMSEKQQENISQLQGEYSSLLSAFDEAVKNGSIEKYSADWYEMLGAINDVELEIQSATTELIEFNQTLQQLSWESFDRVQGYVNNIVTESEHFIDILDAYDLHTDKGIITEEGLAVQGLHAVNYNTYMEQALAYADEMAKIEEEMAKDPYDMELVDRRNELLGLQQEAIQNAMSEKEAIRDLISDGYDKMLNSLDELINKRKEALQAEKDMYDYQNSISEKTSNIASLKKQLQAYSGDNSESAKATIQKLQVSLSEAEKDLQETEYERYLSDQEQMLDALYDQTEQWVNERLDNLDGLVAEAVDATNQNAETISNAIHEAANAYGYKLTDQMETIWDYEENAIDGVCTIVSVYGDVLHGVGEELLNSNTNITSAITGGTTNVINAINGLNVSMQNMITTLNNIANSNKESISKAQNAVVNNQPNNNISTATPTTQNPTTSSNGVSGTGGNAWSPKYEAKIGNHQVGRSYSSYEEAYKAAEEEIERRIQAAIREAIKGKSGAESDAIARNIRMGLGAQLTGQIYIDGPKYASGTKNAKRGLGIFGEAGDEILVANDGSILLSSGATLYPFQGGETVFNAKDTSEILNSSLVPLGINDLNKLSPNMSGIVKNTGGNVENDIHLNIAVKANNYDEFCSSFKTAIKTDPQCRKLVQAVTIDEVVGKGGLRRNKL